MLLKEIGNLLQNKIVGLTHEEEVLLSQSEVINTESKILEKRARDIYPYEFFGVGFTRMQWYISVLMDRSNSKVIILK